MRLGISKSKNTINYYIIKDYTKNGKRSTKHVERIGNLEEVKQKAGNQDYKQWLKEYVKKFYEPTLRLFLEKNDEIKVILYDGFYRNILIKTNEKKYFINL